MTAEYLWLFGVWLIAKIELRLRAQLGKQT
jgi:hypothetical protein